MSGNMIPITVLVSCFNEEANIRFCIESLISWVEKVFVVDSFSTDKTVEIAKEYAPKVEVVQHEWEGYARQKNWALDNLPIETEWAMFLDADEVVTEKLRREIERALPGSTEYDGFWIKRRLVFMGKTLHFCVGGATAVLRLFRYGKGHYEDRKVHERLIVDGSVGWLKNSLVHHDRKPIFRYLERHNTFSDLEAKERLVVWCSGKRSEGMLKGRFFGTPAERVRFIKERVWRWIPFKPLVIFLWKYVFRLGFIDGKAGLHFCLLHAVQELHIQIKLRELRLRTKANT